MHPGEKLKTWRQANYPSARKLGNQLEGQPTEQTIWAWESNPDLLSLLSYARVQELADLGCVLADGIRVHGAQGGTAA